MLSLAGLTSERIGIARETDAGGANPSEPTPKTLKAEVRQDRVEVCDKIIAVFRAKPSSDWRKLIAFSKQWKTLAARWAFRPAHSVGLGGGAVIPVLITMLLMVQKQRDACLRSNWMKIDFTDWRGEAHVWPTRDDT